MKILNLVQGSPEWLAHRRTARNASDAPVMMGATTNMSRRELVRLRAVGLDREHSDYVQKFILDRGHEVEPALRAYAERLTGEDFYPIVAASDDGYLSASFDGVTLDEAMIIEAKQFSCDKAECINRGKIPPSDYWQVVQQFAVCESASECVYLVGDGTDDGTHFLRISRASIKDDIHALRMGWEQFDKDVEAYQPEPASAPAPVGRAPETLPALHIEVTGKVTASNLIEYKAHALEVFAGINRDLKTDEDFANAEKTVKWCGDVEERLKAAKQHALSQTASIDELFRAIDDISAEARRVRLDLDKLVKARKDTIREEIVSGGVVALRIHIEALNERLGEQLMPDVPADFAGSIKGKKSLSSMRDAVDTELARAKIAANEIADRIQINLQAVREREDLSFLFPDVKQLVPKARDDLAAVIAMRIAEHERKEADRREAQKAAAEAIELAAQAVPAADPPPVAPVAAPTLFHTGVVEAVRSQAVREDEPHTMKLGVVCERLGFNVTADFLAGLGIQAHVERSAKLYRESDFPRICSAIVIHINKVLTRAELTGDIPS